METVTLTIDGRPVTVEKGKTVLQAAIEAGISVPYYCYHPGLGIDGSCRVCVVKIEKMPKLQTSCSTTCTDGMVVSTRDPEMVQARAGVFEFLLVNHPARLPGLRQGRRVPAAGLLLHVRAGRKPHGLSAPRVRRRRREGRRRLRADADAQPQPLHPLHALRPVHARGRRRRTDRHRRSRLRQRDRDVPGGGRALAALRQPDGRLPGRRHHHARLPLQEPSLGQPERRRHDVHAVLEGVQHQRVAQGQARVGRGLAADSHDAAFQPRRQQLLDVRHRPLQLSLDRGRDAPAPADAPDRRGPREGGLARRRAAAARPSPGGRVGRPGIGPLPRVGARVDRGTVRAQADARGTARRRTGSSR